MAAGTRIDHVECALQPVTGGPQAAGPRDGDEAMMTGEAALYARLDRDYGGNAVIWQEKQLVRQRCRTPWIPKAIWNLNATTKQNPGQGEAVPTVDDGSVLFKGKEWP